MKRAKRVQLALYDCCDDDERLTYIGRVFNLNNPEDVKTMRGIIAEYNSIVANGEWAPMVLGVFPPQRRKVS